MNESIDADRALSTRSLDPALKESILGDLRIANAFVLERRPDLGIPVFLIALRRWMEASA